MFRSMPAPPRQRQTDESSSALLDALKAYWFTSLAGLQTKLANCLPATPGSTSMAVPATILLVTLSALTGEDKLLQSEEGDPQP